VPTVTGCCTGADNGKQSPNLKPYFWDEIERKSARTITGHDVAIWLKGGGFLRRLDKATFDTDDWISLNVDELAELKADDPVFVITYSETLFDGSFCEWLTADRPPQGETKVAQPRYGLDWKMARNGFEMVR
jgi:hypothetical protein